MRAALVLVVLVVLGGIAAAQPRATAIGFDHNVHDRNIIVKGGESLACARCHAEKQGKLVGRPGHAACFGACHGAPPAAPKKGTRISAGDRLKVCTNCHAEVALQKPFTGKLAVAYPPYTNDQDFNVSFGHKKHAAVTCTQCHDTRAAAPKVTAHARCASCHDGSSVKGRGPAMTKCSTCHPASIGARQPPELAQVTDSVASTFSHPKHAARGALGKDCATCHAPIRATDDTQLPRPTVKDCATSSCHDGKGAFAVTVACTKCHDRAPALEAKFEVHRPTARFLHGGVHARALETRTCISCHALGGKGEVVVAGHGACAECHAADFGARRPTICGACHNATEPWRRLVADRAPAERTEFGAMLDHAKHPAACTTCHTLRTASSQLRTPRGHSSCMGAGCHAPKTGPVPRFESCDGCHRFGLANERATLRAKAPWSVRVAFDHATHRVAADTKELACRTCHDKLDGRDLLSLATPKKAACVACHDAGKPAFKLTGTSCGRCHSGAAK